ncbi:SpoIIE family protein phosphatase [Acetivibrio cellulolyticus]|uniref:SpoIIE family protein phosphatase n=1 Tax=Acetivibrio cellulolyticus TaxID=35830 RepID=UPI0001E2E36D|nr:SpoIIE family protein phosphatase [Acetivibrio cellulolyticus]
MNSYENELSSGSQKNFSNMIEYIVNGMYDWVRVIDLDDNLVYVNKAMSEALERDLVGKKCYTAIGRDTPCENCVSRSAVFNGIPQHKEELILDRTYSVMSSPIKDNEGNIIAVVEVLRDITEMKNLQKEIIKQNKKLQSELNIARKLQCSLLPKELPEDKIEFSYIYKPCETLGGDFLDIFKIDAEHIGVYIADVSGHGVAASMLTVFLRSSINKNLLSPAAALKNLYTEFNRDYSDQDFYITVFYAIIDLENNTLVYSNAGHNVSPIIFNPANNKFELLRIPGIPISNWVEAPVYIDRSLALEKSDRLFLYTDGIVELKNADHEQFGEDRLVSVLQKEDSSPHIILDQIIEAASKFAGIEMYTQVPDDITMALIKIK